MTEAIAKRSPPYASHLPRDEGMVMIRCGTRAWELSKPNENRAATLVFPKGTDPREYNWPVSGKQVVVLAGDEEVKLRAILVIELLNAGADAVHLYEATPGHEDEDWGIHAPQITTYRRPNAQ